MSSNGAVDVGQPTRRAEARCSPTAKRGGSTPAGTAGSFQGLFVVERPLPWPADATEIDELRNLRPALKLAAAERRSHRLQLVLAPPSDRTEVRVTYHRRTTGLFGGYVRAGFDVGPDEVGDLCLDLLHGRVAYKTGPDRTEVLLCTHGRRDVCCGASGTALHTELTRSGLPPGVSLRRTSHTGGHRFAPTALLLPTGTAWAWLDRRVFTGIVTQTLAPEEAAAHYRGCMGLDGPAVQAVDAALFRARGWAWLATPREGEVLSRDDDHTVVRLHYRSTDDGVLRSVRAVVRVARRTPVPRCGVPLDGSETGQEDWELVEMAEA